MSKKKAVLASTLSVLVIVYCGLVFGARLLPIPVGLSMGRLTQGQTLSDLGLTRFVLGAGALWLEKGDHLQLAYDADARLGALYVELASLRVDGPAYKSVHFIPGKSSGRLIFTVPYTGVYQLGIGASPKRGPDGPEDALFDVSYEVKWNVQ